MLLAAGPETSAPLVGPLRDHGFEIAAPGARADVVIAGAAAEVERLSAEAPVILLGGADDAPVDRVLAFQRGCDDYIPPPFHHEELVERIRAVLRRRRTAEPRVLYAGELRDRRGEPDRDARRRAAAALAARVRAARDPRHRADAGVHARRAAARGLGLAGRDDAPARSRRTPHACAASSARSTLATPWIDNEWGVGYRLIGLHPEMSLQSVAPSSSSSARFAWSPPA